ncbi:MULTISPECIES: hypothetical protein [Vibrio]|uniref:Heat shock protein HtpX n=1 Tax=Vibrio atlanticus (strain LGP32) TaxID=575788 RepID=B7VH12_VIBA3|nr:MULTISPECIES: hypothetical protein [Vibrio]EAQ53311.1 hypothetical protein MED222_12333 [Vibrio sp. MED222]WKY57164.1 hypothetical protein Q5H80_09145 [Vibrio sp. SNU_ST1]CAV19212.1 hypothetical protein VS_2036 [Vibrio atlanticus]
MVEGTNTQMAIDLLCCHLGITEEEAKKQIGILTPQAAQTKITETQQALMGLTKEH